MKVALVAFQGDDGPLVVQSWPSTSIKEEGFLMANAYRDEEVWGGI